jgi:hypothetical protein
MSLRRAHPWRNLALASRSPPALANSKAGRALRSRSPHEGDFVERQNPAYDLLCQSAGEAKASPAFF